MSEEPLTLLEEGQEHCHTSTMLRQNSVRGNRVNYSPFDDLSTEVLSLIVQHIYEAEDLASIARVSRRFNSVTNEVLYDSIVLHSVTQAELLIAGHGLHLEEPRTRYVARHARLLAFYAGFAIEGGEPPLPPELSSCPSYPYEAEPRKRKAVLTLLKACKGGGLRYLSLSLTSDVVAGTSQDFEYANSVCSNGLSCRKLTLSGCEYGAVPYFLKALSPTLEECQTHSVSSIRR
ncbi:hypothetical protein P389DRAFT_89738 [Cystobasidium minutum MCA 4210]|uniref:uncharacterized protein n=1 Tax=Cystobasidium minutum MCA 4210 TaxID=1397322 RepID=UPI0034CE023F|eukprot:jgi/Rhomi1/89738/CE89737_311